MNPLWSHQERGLNSMIEAIESGSRRICITSPTGGGKTRLEQEAIFWARSKSWPVALYTNRRMLFDQTSGILDASGIPHGKRASGHAPKLLEDIQLCMTQTEDSQVYANENRSLHNAKLVLVDEAHVQKGDAMERILSDHRAAGAAIVGFTATPLGIGHLYDELIVAGTNSELRQCGAHVPCLTFGPDEPDTRHIKRQKSGEYSENDVRKVIMTSTIFARTFEWWQKLNPDARPTLLFAPGVAESVWFAEQFVAKGVPSAHIDGDNVWINGHEYSSSPEARQDIIDASQDGRIKLICNRFVMREGIDLPWLYHCIMATVFGALTSFLQSGGRLLRSHPSLEHVILQDHGGSWHKHGSLNADREWELSLDNHISSGLRETRLREKREPEPIVCPKCAAVRLSGADCRKCGFRVTTKSRMVVQVDGSLKEMRGDIYKPRRVSMKSNTEQVWTQMYHRAKRSRNGMTFNQAEALFFVENHYWPPRTLRLMPIEDVGWFRKVKEVPSSQLTHRQEMVQT